MYRNTFEKTKTIYFEALKQFCEPVSLNYFPNPHMISTKKITIEDLYVPLAISDSYVGGLKFDIAEWINKTNEQIAEFEAAINRGETPDYVNPANSFPLDDADIFFDDDEKSNLATPDKGEASQPYYAILRANPGCGKSTFCKRITLAYIKEDKRFWVQHSDSDLPRARTPMYLPLGQLAHITEEDIENMQFEQIAYAITLSCIKPFRDDNSDFVTYQDFQMMMEQLADIDNDALLLIVDGWDELLSKKKEKVLWDKLLSFLSLHKKTSIILTIRSHSDLSLFQSTNESYSDFKSIVKLKRLEGLEENQIEEYCKKWYKLFYDGDTERQLQYQHILAQLNQEKNRSIKQLVKNPLMLSVVLLTSRHQNRLTENKAVLFEEIITSFLKRNVVTKPATVLLSFYAYIAFRMTQMGTTQISLMQLKKIVEQAIFDLQRFFIEPVLPSDFPVYWEELMRTGLIAGSESQIAMYHFAWHRQIQEYLTAYAVSAKMVDKASAKITTIDFISDKFHKSAWQEVIRFIALMGGEKTAKEVFALARQHIQPDNEDYHLWLFELLADTYSSLDMDDLTVVYDARFCDHISSAEIEMLIEWVQHPTPLSEHFFGYIDLKFRESVEKKDRKYGFAAAILHSAKALQNGQTPFAYAEQLLQSENEFEITLGLLVLLMMGWMKHLIIHNDLTSAVDGISFHLSNPSIEKMKTLLKNNTRWLPVIAPMLEDTVLANFISYHEIMDEQEEICLFRLLETGNNDAKKAVETILGLRPLTSPVRDLPISNAIRDKYLLEYTNNLLNPNSYNLAVPGFGRCFALGCWITKEKQTAALSQMLQTIPYKHRELSTSYIRHYLSSADKCLISSYKSCTGIPLLWKGEIGRLIKQGL